MLQDYGYSNKIIKKKIYYIQRFTSNLKRCFQQPKSSFYAVTRIYD